MKSHFNFKSLIFYGVAIASVLILFKAVTAYGEANVKAPIAVGDSHRLSLKRKLPSCPQLNDMILNIQQSGIYLNGFLLPVNTDTQTIRAYEKKPTLNGKLINQQLTLTGIVPQSTVCNQADATGYRKIEIIGQVEKEAIAGKINLYSAAETVEFTAVPEAETPSNH